MSEEDTDIEIKKEVSGEVDVIDSAEKEVEAKLPSYISYEDFVKLDIRIGTITSVEIVEDADKLLKLTVDLGEDTARQVVSGIRTYFEDPQFLVGKQCPFVANLAPRVIRGLESQGMIMASSTEETFALLNPHVQLPPGTKVN